MDFILCWPITTGHGACLGVWLIYPVNSSGASGLPLSQWVLVHIASSLGVGPCFHAPLPPGLVSQLVGNCASLGHAALVSESSCVSILLYPEDSVSVEPSVTIFLPSLPRESLCPVGRDLIKISRLGLRALQPLTFCTVVYLWISVFIPIFCKKKLL